MRIAVIGAGVAGLASARRCLEKGFEFTVYERTSGVGGTWVYDERTGHDEFGLPIHTSMYKNLLTNLPKELMDFPNFPYKSLEDVSFLESWQVQEYIEQFTEHFELKKYIRFCNLVTSVERLENNWQVIAEDLVTKTSSTEYYDAVMVCNGHNASPLMPVFPGMDEFTGVQIHSHDYRIPENFQNMNVLVIGSGPSGVDICPDVAKVANMVFFSHHKPNLLNKTFPGNVKHKPNVDYFTERSVCFEDKTVENLDAIIYCTGFKVTLPFLKQSCGIDINDNLITPLHKNIINMNNPTMGFIGFLNMTFVFRVFDLQVRYYLEFLCKTDIKNLTLKEDWMIAVDSHFMGSYLEEFCTSLALDECKVEPIPRVYFEMYRGCHAFKEKYFRSYHSSVFKLINDDNYLIKFDEKNAHNK